MSRTLRLAVNTGGGDAPGLNAVIRSVTLSAIRRGWDVVGIRRGYEGLGEEEGLLPLTEDVVRNIAHLGGTILGMARGGHPLKAEEGPGAGGPEDQAANLARSFRARGLDALVAIGGDGSMRIASALHGAGLPLVGVPKTIDNDLAATSVTFGFNTAVETAAEAIDKLHTTAESHSRIFVVELMGRHAGWIALYAGVAGSADTILIPEIPYRMDRVCARLEARVRGGQGYAIVVVAESAAPEGGHPHRVSGETQRYAGLADRVAGQIQQGTGIETRALVLGHLQRGGGPTAHDRILSLRFGAAAVDLVAEGRFGSMVALSGDQMTAVALEDAIGTLKTAPPEGDLVKMARGLGIDFGN